MNVLDAAYHTVHDYPGGSVALGARMGMSDAVLRSKVNPRCESHHLTLREADRIIGLTEDLRVVQALAAEHGHGLVPLDGSTATSTMAAVLAEHGASGALADALSAALADGVITRRELDGITEAGISVQSAVMSLLRHMAGAVRCPVDRP